jgi:hypothetical protein
MTMSEPLYRFSPLPARDRGQVEVFYYRSYGNVDLRIVAEGTREACSAALRLLRDQAVPERNRAWQP